MLRAAPNATLYIRQRGTLSSHLLLFQIDNKDR